MRPLLLCTRADIHGRLHALGQESVDMAMVRMMTGLWLCCMPMGGCRIAHGYGAWDIPHDGGIQAKHGGEWSRMAHGYGPHDDSQETWGPWGGCMP